MQTQDEHSKFLSIYENSDLSEALSESHGLLAQYEAYCRKHDSDYIWTQEANTWALIRELTLQREGQRLEGEEEEEEEEGKVSDSRLKCDLELADDIVCADTVLGELIVVKEWLEHTAPAFTNCHVKSNHLQVTIAKISKLKNQQPNSVINNQSNIVTTLDPDATNRQRRSLMSEDSLYEKSLNQTVFQCIRRGRLGDAIELCEAAGLFWKAASLRGGSLHSDKMSDLNQGILSQSGNHNRSLWKATAFALSSDDSFDTYERAIYAALSGDVNNVLPVCKSWEDYSWASINSILESRIQEKLYKNSIPLIKVTEICLPLPINTTSTKDIFESLTCHENEGIRHSSIDVFHTVQTHFILNTLDTLFLYFRNRVEQFDGACDAETKHSLRFITHLILLTRNLDLDTYNSTTDEIIIKYIDLLVQEQKGTLIAFYYEYLPVHVQTKGYSRFLQKDDKLKYYELGHRYNLNILEISIETVKSIFQRGQLMEDFSDEIPELTFNSLNHAVCDADLVQINALEWLGFEDRQLPFLINYSNILLRRFLIKGSIEAVKAVLDRFSVDEKVADISDGLIEQEHYRGLVDCFRLHEQCSVLHRKYPKQSLRSGELAEWVESIKVITQTTTAAILDVLRCTTFSNTVESNLKEYELIRCIYVPKLILWVYQINFEIRDYYHDGLRICFELAEMVANVGIFDYCQPFVKSGKLGLFLKMMREAAIASLDNHQGSLYWSSRL